MKQKSNVWTRRPPEQLVASNGRPATRDPRLATSSIAALCMLWFFTSARAATPDAMLGEAVSEYTAALNEPDHEARSERFRRAHRLFRQVAENERVENADLYVNLGNAALQSDQTGEAILAYRRALVTEPGHARARLNLDYARQMLPDWVPRPKAGSLLDTFTFWHQNLSRGDRSLVAALCFGTTAILVAIGIRWKRPWARNAAALPALAWLALVGVSVWSHWSATENEAVITSPQVLARAADSSGAPPRFAEPLPAGTEVRIAERRDDWLRIRLADGRDAWLRTSAVTEVQPKYRRSGRNAL